MARHTQLQGLEVLQDGQPETAYSSAAIFARLCAMLRTLA